MRGKLPACPSGFRRARGGSPDPPGGAPPPGNTGRSWGSQALVRPPAGRRPRTEAAGGSGSRVPSRAILLKSSFEVRGDVVGLTGKQRIQLRIRRDIASELPELEGSAVLAGGGQQRDPEKLSRHQ